MSGFELIKHGFDKDNIISYGNMFLLGNGHIGIRGTLEEFKKSELVGINVVGFYDKYMDKWRESINIPNPFYFDIENHNLLKDISISHKVELDIKRACFRRETEYEDLKITSKRIVHQKIDNLLMSEYKIETKNTTNINMFFGLDTDIYEINGPHYKYKEMIRDKNLIHFHGITNEDKHLYMDVYYQCNKEHYVDFDINYFKINRKVNKGKEIVIQVYAKVYENEFSLKARKEFLSLVNNHEFEEIFISSEWEFEKKWTVSDVKILGNEEAQFAIRYSIYHLLILGNENYATSIPARGLSGQTYKGAIFWDSEIFILPFFLMTNLKIARRLLEYRINTLDGALFKAQEYGFEGAFFAWESQDDGREACSKYNVTDPITNQPIRTYFNEKQIHISFDIAYAFDKYISCSNDYSILSDGGYNVLKEIARFALSYAKKIDEKYHFLDVIGPDEYHERVNDNAFTSYFAKHAVGIYIKYFNYIEGNDLFDVSLDKEFVISLKEFYKNIYLPKVNENQLIEQFEGYFTLEDVDVKTVKARVKHPKEYLGAKNGVATSTRVIKQADVISLLILLENEFNEDIIKVNYDYYYKYTEHGSSLSASMYSIAASKINYLDDAFEMFMKSASIDLGTEQKMFAGGIYIGGTHPASNGGSYLSLLKGMCGMKYVDGKYTFKPHLPNSIDGIIFRYVENDKLLEANVCKNNVVIKEVNYD